MEISRNVIEINFLRIRRFIYTNFYASLLFFCILFLEFFSLIKISEAAIRTINCSSSYDVQSAINSAASGDTLICSANGAYIWRSSIIIPSTAGITLNGNGATINSGVTGTFLILNQNFSVPTRITNFSFISNGTNNKGMALMGVEASPSVIGGDPVYAPFRIDHCTFTDNTKNSVTFIYTSGNAPGLIDNNNFYAGGASEMIHNMGLGPENSAGWTDSITPGSDDAVYIETNNFYKNDLSPFNSSQPASPENPIYFWGNSAVQSYYGARTVFRYNHLLMSHIDQHGTPGMIGARWWEIYDNTFEIVENGQQSHYAALRGGSGVFFDNHKVGYPNLWNAGAVVLYEEDGTIGNCAPYPSPCNGSGNCNCGSGLGDCMCQPVSVGQSDSTYPQLYQIGRGQNEELEIAYFWDNDDTIPVVSGSYNVLASRDYYLSSRPDYQPYIYPHPLRNESGFDKSATVSPSGLSVN